MIELLLVLAIILLTTAIAMPSIVRSFRGARLRASARSVVMTHRHARSKAVLEQAYATIAYDTKGSTLQVAIYRGGRGAGNRGGFLDEREALDAGEDDGGSYEAEEPRALESGIRMESFEIKGDSVEEDGVYAVQYYPNGMCDGYSLRLVDEKNKVVHVEIDPYTGKATTRKEN